LTGSSKGRRRGIVIVEDESTVSDSLKMVLELRGYKTWVADTGPTGLDMLRRFKPDLLVLDLVLPGMDGLSVLEKIREDDRLRKIPVIIITVVTQDSNLPDGFWQKAVGTSAFVTKPFDPFKVADKIDAILAE
jgi:two-component system alkaline phosphatase synthesis response regulator PhoP